MALPAVIRRRGDFCNKLDPARPPEVSMRLPFQPGEVIQVDFGSSPILTDVHIGEVFKTWFFVMALCWSRPLSCRENRVTCRSRNSIMQILCHFATTKCPIK